MVVNKILLLINIAGLLLYRLIFDNSINLTQQVPASVKFGASFVVEVTVNKSSITEFAKFTQELPSGTIVSSEDMAGGSFTFENNSIKIIWMTLPTSSSFTFKYKVTPPNNINIMGLGGKFSYLENNEKKVALLQTVNVIIENANNTTSAQAADSVKNENTTPASQSLTSSNNNTDEATTSDVNFNTTTESTRSEGISTSDNPENNNSTMSQISNVSAKREIKNGQSISEYIIKIFINKEKISGFAKIEENIPTGFIAKEMENASGSFSFVDHKVRILWMNIPTSESIEISYKIINNSMIKVDNLGIVGTFSYLENNETKKTDIVFSPFPNFNSPVELIRQNNNVENVNNTEITKESKQNTNSVLPKVQSDNTSAESQKISYRVQIAAAHKNVQTDWFKSNYFIQDKILSEMHEGWYKYTTGNFSKYNEAKNKRNELYSNKQIPGPFVTAYNSGIRITVQEALIITNQKWVR